MGMRPSWARLTRLRPPWGAVVTIALAVFIAIFLASSWLARERERACSENCKLKGFAGYDYKGFSEEGRLLRTDSCTCTNVGGVAVPDS